MQLLQVPWASAVWLLSFNISAFGLGSVDKWQDLHSHRPCREEGAFPRTATGNSWRIWIGVPSSMGKGRGPQVVMRASQVISSIGEGAGPTWRDQCFPVER